MEKLIFDISDIRWSVYGDHDVLYVGNDHALHTSRRHVLCDTWFIDRESNVVPTFHSCSGITMIIQSFNPILIYYDRILRMHSRAMHLMV